jgi:multidrug efflux system outer membrane protein
MRLNPARLIPVLATGWLAGCAVGPDYERPATDIPEAWRIDYPEAADVANTRWWEQYGDPELDRLIEEALRANHDVRAAAARVDQFIGALTATRSQFFPQLGYSLDASRNRASREGQSPIPAGSDPYYSLYQGALSAGWQIDLFGRVRRESESAQARVYASEQGRRAVVLSLVTSVAASYIVLRGLDRQLEIAQATADNYAGTQRIFEQRHKGGVVSQVELAQVQSQYQQALTAIPQIEQSINAQENLISILLGRNPGPIARGKAIDELAVPGIPADLPAALLERRPDILQAEQNLVAANADVGAAQSLYFPSISLTGLLGLVSTALGDFLSGAAGAWSIAAGAAGPIFTFGAIEGQVQSTEAARRIAEENYRRIILTAFQETNDALVSVVKKDEIAKALAQRVTALRDYARLSRRKFDGGYAGYLEVLYAENELFGAELNAVRARIDRNVEFVNVYKAVGGGWVDEAARLAPQPQLDGALP